MTPSGKSLPRRATPIPEAPTFAALAKKEGILITVARDPHTMRVVELVPKADIEKITKRDRASDRATANEPDQGTARKRRSKDPRALPRPGRARDRRRTARGRRRAERWGTLGGVAARRVDLVGARQRHSSQPRAWHDTRGGAPEAQRWLRRGPLERHPPGSGFRAATATNALD